MHPNTKLKNNMKNERFWLPKWIQNGAKMRGTIVEMAPWEPSENYLQIQPAFCTVLGCLWIPFGTLSGAFWTSWGPFGLPQGPFGLPQAVFLAAFGSFSVRRELAEILTRTSENLQRFRRELAEVQPRTCRGSAENPPITSQEPAV